MVFYYVYRSLFRNTWFGAEKETPQALFGVCPENLLHQVDTRDLFRKLRSEYPGRKHHTGAVGREHVRFFQDLFQFRITLCLHYYLGVGRVYEMCAAFAYESADDLHGFLHGDGVHGYTQYIDGFSHFQASPCGNSDINCGGFFVNCN